MTARYKTRIAELNNRITELANGRLQTLSARLARSKSHAVLITLLILTTLLRIYRLLA